MAPPLKRQRIELETTFDEAHGEQGVVVVSGAAMTAGDVKKWRVVSHHFVHVVAHHIDRTTFRVCCSGSRKIPQSIVKRSKMAMHLQKEETICGRVHGHAQYCMADIPETKV